MAWVSSILREGFLWGTYVWRTCGGFWMSAHLMDNAYGLEGTDLWQSSLKCQRSKVCWVGVGTSRGYVEDYERVIAMWGLDLRSDGSVCRGQWYFGLHIMQPRESYECQLVGDVWSFSLMFQRVGMIWISVKLSSWLANLSLPCKTNLKVNYSRQSLGFKPPCQIPPSVLSDLSPA